MIITLLFNFREEYIIVERTFITTALISLRCAGIPPCDVRRSDFFQVAFTKCVHIRTFLDI